MNTETNKLIDTVPVEIQVIDDTKTSPRTLLDSPERLERALVLCEKFAKSDMVPDSCKGNPGNILARIEMLLGLGITNFLPNLGGIAMINGVPSVWGATLLAVCQGQRSWRDYTVEWADQEGGDWSAETPSVAHACRVTVKRAGRAPKTASFSVTQAKAAGLYAKKGSLWTLYTNDMLLGKARRRAIFAQYSDVLAGITAAEDAAEYQVIEGEQSQPETPVKMDIKSRLTQSIHAKDRGPSIAEIENIKKGYRGIGVGTDEIEKIIGKQMADITHDDILVLRKDFKNRNKQAKLVEKTEFDFLKTPAEQAEAILQRATDGKPIDECRELSAWIDDESIRTDTLEALEALDNIAKNRAKTDSEL